jgi:hypothetical protein
MDQSMMDLIALFRKYYDLEREFKEKMEEARETKESFEQVLYDKMISEGVQNLKTDKLGTFYLRDDRYASVKAETKEAFFDWLRESGYGDLIQPTVNARTLTSWVNEQTEGKELEDDDELSQFINVTVKHRVGVRSK